MRAPLTSIKGSAATVLNAKPELDPAEMREFFRIVDEQADHMRGLIGDLLDVGRINSGTLSVSPEPAEVAGLVKRARNTFVSGGGRHSVLIDLPPDLPRAMAAHAIPNGRATDVAFFGGIAVFALVGCRHQDLRKLAAGDPTYKRFHAATSFLPFTGRGAVRGLMELPPLAVIVGIVVALVARCLHPSIGGCGVFG